MASDYLQAIVTRKANASTDEVRTWFESRGFSTMPMREEHSMLITGTGSLVEQVFGPGTEISPMQEADRALPVPAEQDQLSSIAVC